MIRCVFLKDHAARHLETRLREAGLEEMIVRVQRRDDEA